MFAGERQNILGFDVPVEKPCQADFASAPSLHGEPQNVGHSLPVSRFLTLPWRHIVQVGQATGRIQGCTHPCPGAEWLHGMSASCNPLGRITTRQEPQCKTLTQR